MYTGVNGDFLDSQGTLWGPWDLLVKPSKQQKISIGILPSSSIREFSASLSIAKAIGIPVVGLKGSKKRALLFANHKRPRRGKACWESDFKHIPVIWIQAV